jgi:hypothetical protein
MEAQSILRDAVRSMEIASFSWAEECLKSVMLMELHGPGLRTLWMDIEMEL